MPGAYAFDYRPVCPIGFIIGMSRSGTTWMVQALNRQSSAAAFGETGFWGKHFLGDRASSYGPEECNRVLSRMPGERGIQLEPRSGENLERLLGGAGLRKLFEPLRRELVSGSARLTPREVFDRICGVVAGYSGKSLVVEKTPHHVNHVDRILAAYPNARFIVMQREPYGFMRSYKHQGDRKAERVRQGFEAVYHPIGCALVYRGYARSILRLRHAHPERVLAVSLERVADDGPGVLREVGNFLGLQIDAGCTLDKANSSFPAQDAAALAPEDVYWMNVIAGRQIRALGYTLAPTGPFTDGLPSLVRLPGWAWRAVRRLAAYQNTGLVGYLRRWLS
jgi:hypothetical protein